MFLNNGLGLGLSTLPLHAKGKTRWINGENPTGAVGAAGKTASYLGVGRKGHPCLVIPSGETAVLADIKGAGVIQHFWVTTTDRTDKGFFVLRDLILRIYWDDEATPSVEVPIGDFFCNGWGARCDVNSLPIVVNPVGGMNCYFPMPFRTGARITIENQHAAEIPNFFFQIAYTEVEEIPQNALYFHAQWRREKITTLGKDYTILDGVKGTGHYIGTYLAWTALERYWWGEGEIKFYLDGDSDWPTLCGTGTEDYFGGAWGFIRQGPDGKPFEQTYSTPFLGYPFYSHSDTTLDKEWGNNISPMHGLYRWHIMDPIRFEQDLRVTIQQIGLSNLGLFERQDDIASVAYWYQNEPHSLFSNLPSAAERWPR